MIADCSKAVTRDEKKAGVGSEEDKEQGTGPSCRTTVNAEKAHGIKIMPWLPFEHTNIRRHQKTMLRHPQ